jgi:hypothetical protein
MELQTILLSIFLAGFAIADPVPKAAPNPVAELVLEPRITQGPRLHEKRQLNDVDYVGYYSSTDGNCESIIRLSL